MQQINYTFLKLSFILASFCPNLLFGQSYNREKIPNSTEVAVHPELWTKGGTFYGFKPEQEILERRTQYAKHFKNADGSFTAQTGDVYHYRDKNGRWQEISIALESNNSKAGYSYANEANEFKTWFPEKAGKNPVQMELSNSIIFSWWNAPQLNFRVNGQVTQTVLPHDVSSTVSTDERSLVSNTLQYPMVYNGISEEFAMLKNGVENNTIIHTLTPQIQSLPAGATMEFRQFIPLQKGWNIDVNGAFKTKDFDAKNFHIEIPGSENGISFSPVVVFDSDLTKDEALYLVYAPADKLDAREKVQKQKHVYECTYHISFITGGIEVSTLLPSDWLKQSYRMYPVTIDPTVTITPPSATGNYYAPMSNWYGYQRHANVYLASEIGASNILISDIEYNRTNTNGTNAVKPIEIYMNTTTATTATGSVAWNSATYTGGLTPSFSGSIDLHGTTTGWKMISLTTPFHYISDNLLVMGYDAYGGSGSAKYLNRTSGSSVTGRQAYKRQDNTDPGNSTNMSVENYLPEIRLTYTFATACSGTPTAGSISGPTAVCLNAPFIVQATGYSTGSGLTMEWEEAPAGSGIWSPVTTTSSASYAVNAGITTAMDYRFKITCSNGGGNDVTGTFTVGLHPWYNCYCTPASNCTNEGIENVTFDVINNNSTFCTNTSGYSDFAGLGANVSVTQGQNVAISVSARINSNPASVGVWIDYDQSGTFDTTEYTLIGSTTGMSPLPQTYIYTNNIMIPVTAMPGITRMRVRSANQGGIAKTSACTNTGVYGEYEDYLINITAANNCSGTPTAGTINAPASICPSAPFTLTTTGTTNGVLGLTYQWEYLNPNTFTWDPAPGTNTNATYTVPAGITTSMEYRLLITCTNGGGFDVSPSVTIGITPFTQCYCIPSGSSATYGINNFSTTGGATNITNMNSGASPTGYGNFTGQILTASLNDVINFNAAHMGTGTYGFAIFIDYNQNGSFADAGETVFNTTAYANTASGSFTIPATAMPGSTRIRIIANYNSSNPSSQYCITGINGEIEDYTLTIGAPPSCIAPTGVTATNITASGVTINWTASTSNPSVGYDYYYTTSNTPPASTTVPIGSVGPSTTSVTISTLSGSTTYYFWVRSDCGGNDYSAWNMASFATLLSNDMPSGAIPLTVNASCVTYSNAGASFSTNEPAVSCRGGNINQGALVWFKFVAPQNGFVRVSTDGATTNLDTKLGLFTTSNPSDPTDLASFSIIACDDDNGLTYSTSSTLYASGLTPGVTYYVGVDHYNGTSTNSFCMSVDSVTPSMISPTGACAATGETPYSREDYTGWATLIDNQGRLIANTRRTTAGGSNTVYNYSASLTVNTSAVRQSGTQFYLDRNFLLGYGQSSPATTFDVKLYFLNAELAALQAVDASATLGNLNVTHQTGSTCYATYTSTNGTNSVLAQSGNGTASNISWIQVNTPGFSNFYIMSGPFALSIKLGEITATNVDSRNRVDWNTESELKSDVFELERSFDGTNFRKLATIAAKGEASNYSYWDETPANGLNHYRLKMTDAAGKVNYSKTVTAFVKGNGSFTVEAYPNPVNNILTVVAKGATSDATITITDITGKVVRTITAVKGFAEIDVKTLIPGMYLVKYMDGEHTKTIKINRE